MWMDWGMVGGDAACEDTVLPLCCPESSVGIRHQCQCWVRAYQGTMTGGSMVRLQRKEDGRQEADVRRWIMWSSAVGGIVLLTLGLLLAEALAAHAQPPAKVPRIGVLWERTPTDPFIAAFRQGLRELGYTEGQNLVIEERYADGVVDRYPALIAALLDLHIDVLVVAGTNAAQAAKARTATVPIVFTLPGTPVEDGLVASFAHPGGNATGLSTHTPGLTG